MVWFAIVYIAMINGERETERERERNRERERERERERADRQTDLLVNI